MRKEYKIELLIIKSFSGSCTPEINEQISSWVNESAKNRSIYQELKNIWQVSQPKFSPSDIDVAAAERKVLGQIQERKFFNTNIILFWQRIASILFIPVIMFSGYLMYKQSIHSTSSDMAYQEVSSIFGMVSKVVLPDGSTVWLNSGSKLKYPLVFALKERNVYLSGEAFFKVHADKSHPFIISTQKLNVTATGTQFNVEAYATDTITAVTLVEGNVNVNIGRKVNEKLRPNQRFVFNSNYDTYKLVEEADALHWGIWKDGILAFRDEPLDDVFKRIGRTFNVDIKVKDAEIGHHLYRATFEGEPLDEMLRLLKMTAPIKYKRTERNKPSDNKQIRDQIEVYKAN